MSIIFGTKNWNICRPDFKATAELQKKTKLSRLVSALLCVRGFDSAEKVSEFLKASDMELCDPLLFDGMQEAAKRLNKAIEHGEKICIYGDYDVDGITSVSLMCRYLNYRNAADFTYYIPERLGEGYGMNMQAVKKLNGDGVSLIVTVDNGVSAADEIRYAYELGMEVIVTDHHECRCEIPDCVAVIDPKCPDCGYPFTHLAGVGTAYKLICAAEKCANGNGADKRLSDKYLELVALGTIADMMPICGENRTIVARGIAAMQKAPCCGISALLSACAAEKGKNVLRKVDTAFVSFTVAPRINAAGRIGDVKDAVKLLMTDDISEAEHLAEHLCRLNSKRQSIENTIFTEACEKIEESHNFQKDKVIVIAGEGWNHGVVGIVSSRVTEKYRLPSILISLENGVGKGSARSIPGFNINEAISCSRELLIRFGGHELAAGLTIEEGNIVAFRKSINDFARDRINDEMLCGTLDIDAELCTDDISVDSTMQIRLLEPYGCGNPQPVFCICDAVINEIIPIGQNKHLKLTISKNNAAITALLFGVPPDSFDYLVGDRADFAFNLDINEFNGRRTVQLIVRDIRLCKRDRELVDNAVLNYRKAMNGEKALLYKIPDVAEMREFFVFLRSKETFFSGGASLFFVMRLFNKDRSVASSGESILVMLSVFREMGLIECKKISDGHFAYSVIKGAPKVKIESSPTLLKLQKLKEG